MRTVMERLADHALKMAEERIEQEKQAEIAEEVAKIKADLEREHAKEKADFEMSLIRSARAIMSTLNCSADAALKIMQLRNDKAEAVRKALEQ